MSTPEKFPSENFTNWTRWNKHDNVSNRANSLLKFFKWRFRNRRHRCCLRPRGHLSIKFITQNFARATSFKTLISPGFLKRFRKYSTETSWNDRSQFKSEDPGSEAGRLPLLALTPWMWTDQMHKDKELTDWCCFDFDGVREGPWLHSQQQYLNF